MVKIFSFIILCLFSLLSFADSSLQLIVDEHTSELGNPIPARIVARDIQNNLSLIDISNLKKDFGVEIIESASKLEGNVNIQTLVLKLYPRNIGVISIPALRFNEQVTTPLNLNIKPAKANHGTVQIETSYSASSVWQRQQLTLLASVITPSKFAIIELDKYTQTGVEAYTLPVTKQTLANGQYKITTGWKLYPLISGKQTFIPPSLNYRLNGKIQRKFFPPSNVVNVRKLPSYIPPLMPVGELSFNSTVTPDYLWRIEFFSKDILPLTMSSLSVPLERITTIPTGNVSIDTGSDNRYTHNIALKPAGSGIYTLPELDFITFNPTTGKIQTQRIVTKEIIFINTWLKVILVLLGALITYRLLSHLIKYIQRLILHRKQKNKIISAILIAKSPNELHSLLNQYAEIQKWGKNLSLTQWAAYWYRFKNISADVVINELSLACYAKHFEHSHQDNLNKSIYALISR